MDTSALMASGTTGAIVVVIYALYKVLKNSKCTSNCCGKVSSLSVHLEQEAFPIDKPAPKIVLEQSKDATKV